MADLAHDTNFADPQSAEVARNLSQADRADGMPHTGTHAITAESGGVGPENHPDPTFGFNGTGWVALAMIVFLAILVWKKVPALITGGLDRQIADIRRQLDEAKALRVEAEKLRDEYAAKIASAEGSAQAMLTHAEAEAGQIVEQAKADAADLVTRRGKMAEDKIAAAERTAIAEVRARAADAAATAAGSLIAGKLSADGDRAMVDRTIAGLGRPN